MIVTTHIENYPIVDDIFADLGHKITSMQTESQIMNTNFAGLILLGGPDIHPSIYGQRVKYPELSRHNWERDQLEWFLLHTAFKRNVPILGICRGMQLLNVACQGTLWQNLKRDGQLGEVNHRAKHKILVRGPLIDKIPLTVNSRHHQAVDRIGDGLETVAWSNDGVCEAIYRPGALGVQWHPEDLYFEEAGWKQIFKWFLAGLK